jgi:hypothetical protein
VGLFRRKKKSFLSTAKDSEHTTQAHFFAMLSRVNHPAVAITVAVPNQALALLTKTARFHFAREGCRGGVPDVMCLHPGIDGGCLFIEFKKPGEGARPNQIEWMKNLAAVGHTCFICDDAKAAVAHWKQHLGIPT